jgi:hypothetical protein
MAGDVLDAHDTAIVRERHGGREREDEGDGAHAAMLSHA